MRKTKKSTFETVLFSLCIILCVMVSLQIGSKVLNDELHPDELLYVYYAGLFKSFFITHNINNPYWYSDLRYSAVPIGVYVIGLDLYYSPWRSMMREPDTILSFVRFSDGAIEKHPVPHVADLIYIVRSNMLVFMALCVVLIFALGWHLGWYYCGLPAVYLLLANRYFVSITGKALLESIWLFQHFLNILLILAYLSRWQNKEKKEDWLLLLALLIGISAGFLTGTKIHGALNIVIFLICYLAVLVKQILLPGLRRTAILKSLFHVSIIIGVSFFVFVLFNPALYANPAEGIKEIIFKRFHYFSAQISCLPFASLPTFMSRLKFVIQIVHPTFVTASLFLIGFAALGRKIAKSFEKDGSIGIYYLLGTAFLVELAAILKCMEVAFPRYVIVLLPYFYLIVCYGATWLVKKLFHLLKISRFNTVFSR